jgi:hypothetical protein
MASRKKVLLKVSEGVLLNVIVANDADPNHRLSSSVILGQYICLCSYICPYLLSPSSRLPLFPKLARPTIRHGSLVPPTSLRRFWPIP